jgi:hypothetical protein
MTARRLAFSPSGRDVVDAKASARRAYDRARKAAGLASVVIDRLWADTLMACDGREAVTQAEMMRRTEHLFVLLHDRATWAKARS